QTCPIHGTVPTDQYGCLHVADHCVVFNPAGHTASPPSRSHGRCGWRRPSYPARTGFCRPIALCFHALSTGVAFLPPPCGPALFDGEVRRSGHELVSSPQPAVTASSLVCAHTRADEKVSSSEAYQHGPEGPITMVGGLFAFHGGPVAHRCMCRGRHGELCGEFRWFSERSHIAMINQA